MDMSLRNSILIATLLLCGVACTPKPNSDINADAKTTTSVERALIKNMQQGHFKSLRSSEMSLEDKELRQWTGSLHKSHEIFREVWAHIWEDRMQNPMSVFFELERLVQTHKNITDGHFRAEVSQCPKASSQIEVIRNLKGSEIEGAVFYRIPCDGTRPMARIEMARVVKTGATRAWTFHAEQMVKGAGASLSLLKEQTKCRMRFDDRSKLSQLECENLGQNRNPELHLVFSTFKYERSGQTLVLVEGKKFKLLQTAVCDNPKFCTKLRVPMTGSIEIFEDSVSEVARQDRQRAQELKEHAEQVKEMQAKQEKFVADLQERAQNLAKPVVAAKAAGLSGHAPKAPVANQLPAGSEPQFEEIAPMDTTYDASGQPMLGQPMLDQPMSVQPTEAISPEIQAAMQEEFDDNAARSGGLSTEPLPLEREAADPFAR